MVSTQIERAAGFRTDIQALRAFAVLAVLVYHLWPGRLPGGFAGVDVFFVISGFLITGALVREAEGGRIDLARFWARRARRILPAALVVLAVVGVAVVVWVPQNLWRQFFGEITASTLYVENWRLAADSVDYLAAHNTASPVQHFWSLSVEEQFYIAVPVLLVALLWAVRRFGWQSNRRRLVLATFVVVTAAGFACSVWLTAVSAPTAYFATVTRVWEFGVGALLVFAPALRRTVPATTAFLVGAVGLVAAVLLLSSSTPYPGTAAALPVLATALVIWGGQAAATGLRAVTGLRPVRFVGDVSYSVYLWHWPLIVLLPFVTGSELGTAEKLAIVAASLVLGWASTRFVENPVRFSPRLLGARPPRAVLGWGAAAMAAVLAGSVTGSVYALTQDARAQDAVASATARYESCLGALDTGDGCDGAIPDGLLVPPPAQAAADDVNSPDCWSGVSDPAFNICTLGPADSAVRIAVIGDSHSNRLLTTYRAIAEDNGWRIDLSGHNGCYWTTAVQQKPAQDMVDACESWKSQLEAHLAAQPPYDAIVVTNARRGAPPIVAEGAGAAAVEEATVEGLVDAWAPQVARGTRIIALRDNPTMRDDVVTCVTEHPDPVSAVENCATPRSEALGGPDPLMEAVQRTEGAEAIDLSDLYCPDGVCLPVIGHVVVYGDKEHFTVTFAKTLQKPLEEALRPLLGLPAATPSGS
ncbi:acyltransferase [Herbiconiux moechotypicola]|uniref:Acyltransferase family protein n=1 Tax=Herbiconiux moechotypicola TaxID=637393 RepID=A0ABP5QQU4_9MICO|nr:acyltransferase family protein [Herbiconiux moechotypicola]MCS5731014.1 acyltransferase [Herbiconiux moechotypicola]